jgi:hypothetical protein
MSCEKVTQNEAQPVFYQNLNITGAVEKSSSKMSSTSVVFKPLPKVNNRPIGEKSPY